MTFYLELMLSIILMGLLSLWALPAYQHWHETQNFNRSAQQLEHALILAKTLSITRGKDIYFCASETQTSCSPDWQGKFILFESQKPPTIQEVDEELPALPPEMHLQYEAFHSTNHILFAANGEFNYNGHFVLSAYGRSMTLTLSTTGVVR